MFRRFKPHEPYAFDVAAERVLEGWKHAGEPILVKQIEAEEEEYENLAKNLTENFIEDSAECRISSLSETRNKSSTEELLHLARNLANIKFS